MQVIGQDNDGGLTVVAITPEQLATAAALDASAFSKLNVEESVPGSWEERAKLAWEYYTEEPIVKNAVNAWRTFAIGDAITLSCEDEDVQTDARAFAARAGLDAFVRDMVLQLLVKGDCVGYKSYTEKGDDIAALQCINPVSVKLKVVQGELTEVRQFPEEGAIGEGIELPLEQLLHLKWDAPSFSPRGNSIVLPAFHAIALLRDYRKSEQAIAKRWTTPLRFIQVGGQFGTKLIMPDQGMLDRVRDMLNKMDIKSGLVVPFYCNVKTYGTEGDVLKTEDKVKEIKEDVIVALGLARSIVTGDGPNFATASVSMQKMIIMLAEIKGAARKIIRWVLDDWGEMKGHGDKTIETLFNDLDLSDDADFRKLLVELYDRRLISRKSLQVRMNLDPEVETTQSEAERKELDLTDEKAVKPIVDLVNAGVITPEYAREVLGVPQEKNRTEAERLDVAAGLFPARRSLGVGGSQGDVPEGMCDECEYFDAEENWCSIRETATRFDNNACRYFEAREDTVTTPAADATARPASAETPAGRPKGAEECMECRYAWSRKHYEERRSSSKNSLGQRTVTPLQASFGKCRTFPVTTIACAAAATSMNGLSSSSGRAASSGSATTRSPTARNISSTVLTRADVNGKRGSRSTSSYSARIRSSTQGLTTPSTRRSRICPQTPPGVSRAETITLVSTTTFTWTPAFSAARQR